MNKAKVLLADDHTIVRKGLRSLLADEADIEVVGEAENGREAVEKAEQLHPDVVVMDITMSVLNGLEATCQIKKRCPAVNILILSVHANEEYVFQTLHAGASGYLVKQAAPSDLVSAIRATCRGESFFSPSISRKVIEQYIRQGQVAREKDDYDRLTSREREVLQLIAEGRSSRQIAEILSISIKTVETHRANLMDKLQIHTTAELTQYAMRKGVIGPDPLTT